MNVVVVVVVVVWVLVVINQIFKVLKLFRFTTDRRQTSQIRW